MFAFEHEEFDYHESIHFFQDSKTGLKAIIAIHSTTLGLAVGGCRFWSYPGTQQAVYDVLRLSKGMSYKAAMAGLELGGGKSVILKPEGDFDRKALFESFGRCVDQLGGSYITAEDVGVSVEDMHDVKRTTNFVAGLSEGQSASGDPSPFTAKGVFLGLKASAKHAFGTEDLSGIKIAVQGVGHVGGYLCQYLSETGADLVISDVNTDLLRQMKDQYSAKSIRSDQIYDQDVDIFAPCALGAVINPETIHRLKAKVIAGAANNQLSSPEIGLELIKKEILYAPDYIINAGGIINIYGELSGHYDPKLVNQKLERLADTLIEIYTIAEKNHKPTNFVANDLARRKINRH